MCPLKLINDDQQGRINDDEAIETLHRRWLQHERVTIVDVRRNDEWREGYIPDSIHLPLGDLPQHMHRLPKDQPLAVICRSGYRAEIGASILAAYGYDVIAVRGGVPDWLERNYPVDNKVAPFSDHVHS